MREHMKDKNLVEQGFTLIELLVVIAILGILAGVVVFAVGGITDRGKSAACSTEVATIRTALEAYNAKIGGYPIAAGTNGLDGVNLAAVDPNKFLNSPITADSPSQKLTDPFVYTIRRNAIDVTIGTPPVATYTVVRGELRRRHLPAGDVTESNRTAPVRLAIHGQAGGRGVGKRRGPAQTTRSNRRCGRTSKTGAWWSGASRSSSYSWRSRFSGSSPDVVVFSVGGVTDRGKSGACKTEVSAVWTALEAYNGKIGGYPIASGTEWAGRAERRRGGRPEQVPQQQNH